MIEDTWVEISELYCDYRLSYIYAKLKNWMRARRNCWSHRIAATCMGRALRAYLSAFFESRMLCVFRSLHLRSDVRICDVTISIVIVYNSDPLLSTSNPQYLV